MSPFSLHLSLLHHTRSLRQTIQGVMRKSPSPPGNPFRWLASGRSQPVRGPSTIDDTEPWSWRLDCTVLDWVRRTLIPRSQYNCHLMGRGIAAVGGGREKEDPSQHYPDIRIQWTILLRVQQPAYSQLSNSRINLFHPKCRSAKKQSPSCARSNRRRALD